MSLFHTDPEYPSVPEGDFDVVLRSSICNGEEVLCLKDRQTGDLKELMLIKTPSDLEGFCDANGIPPESIRKIY